MDLQSGQVTKPPPRFAASAEGFYDFDVDGKSLSFESHFEKLETAAAPVIRRVIDEQSLSNMTQRERMAVAEFVSAQSFRTEAFYKGLANSPSRNAMADIYRQLVRSAFIASSAIYHRTWGLMKIEGPDNFYLGDQPVVLQMAENPTRRVLLGFDVEGTEAFLPISSKFAIYMLCRSVSDVIIDGYESRLKLRDQLLKTGEVFRPGEVGLLGSVHEKLTRHKGLYESFKFGSAFECEPENVENLNYLQCAWAFRAIYSSRQDFQFAKHVFEESPQYREPPKTSMHPVWPIHPDKQKI